MSCSGSALCSSWAAHPWLSFPEEIIPLCKGCLESMSGAGLSFILVLFWFYSALLPALLGSPSMAELSLENHPTLQRVPGIHDWSWIFLCPTPVLLCSQLSWAAHPSLGNDPTVQRVPGMLCMPCLCCVYFDFILLARPLSKQS